MANELSTQQQSNELGILGALVNSDIWNRLVKVAEIFAKSKLVPQQFQGNTGDCLIALQMAMRMQVDPFMLMQAMYVVHGKPGIEAKMAIALCNSKGIFRGPIRYELSGSGTSRGCTAWAIDRETGGRLEETVTMDIAEREGWTKKSGSKWLTIPDLMLKYRSAAWLIRTHCPEVLMGLHTKEELQDIPPDRLQGPRPDPSKSATEQLADQLMGAEDEMPADSEPAYSAEDSQEPADPAGEESQEQTELSEKSQDIIDKMNRAETRQTIKKWHGEAQQLHVAKQLTDGEFAEIEKEYEACMEACKK